MTSAAATPGAGTTGPGAPGAGTPAAAPPAAGPTRGWHTAVYVVLLLACALLSLAWLVIGGIAALAQNVPSFAGDLAFAAAEGDRWAQGVLDAAPRSEPVAQALLDYGFSLLNIGIAVAMLVARWRSWSIRLLALAMVGSAGAFNLQAHAATTAVQTATGLGIGGLHQVLLHGVACAAYIVALMVFPTVRGAGPGSGTARTALAVVGVGTLLLVGFGTALLPHTTSCVLFFGFGVPLAGLAALPRRIRRGTTAEERTQGRLLFSVLVAVFAVAIVLAIITLLLWSIGWTGLTLVDPTAHGALPGEPVGAQPTALLFWFSRLACVAIAGAVLVAMRRGGLWTAERLFSRGLVAALVAALVGGGYVVVQTVAGILIESAPLAVAVIAIVPAALLFLPVYVRIERLVDALLYGTRPTPYSVLAGIAELARSTAVDAPDLARVAEAVGRGLGATTCRLTVIRPGLRDRTYAWAEPGAHDSDALVEVPVRHGSEQIGSIAVDQASVAGLHAQRQHLLEDIADSLGAVLQASRLGIELERQLRAALSHAGDIAVSRRAAVAAMDGERRRIERDLHDGAQHHLVSLRLVLGLVEHQVSTGQFEQARGRLDQIAEKIDTAEAILAATASGVSSSPLLAERGLVGALEAELAGGHPPVAVVGDAGVRARRFPADVEAAVWFCCLEAVNNARKHARGAAVEVRIAVAADRLRFTVRDEGPGWDRTADKGSPGRGVRNVTTRISAVGGRIEIDSAPGAGTTVEGSVPLPAEPTPAREPAASGLPASGPAAPAASVVTAALVPDEVSLLDQVRDAVRAARELYRAGPHAEPLRVLAEQLDEPLRVAVVGPQGSRPAALAGALAAAPGAGSGAEPVTPVAIELPGPGPAGRSPVRPGAEVYVLLLRHGHDQDADLYSALHAGPVGHHPAHAIGVLIRADDPAGPRLGDPAVTEYAVRPGVRNLCHAVVPVAIGLARAGATLGEADHRSLLELGGRTEEEIAQLTRSVGAFLGTAPENADAPTTALRLVTDAGPAVRTATPAPTTPATAPAASAAPAASTTGNGSAPASRRELLDRFGLAGVRLAAGLVRSGRATTSAALAAALLERSGLSRLQELIEERFASRAEALKARSALRALDALVRVDPPPGGGRPLLYQLDRIRSGAHELVEVAMVDALWAGEHALAPEEIGAAVRLLGGSGPDPRTRLGLSPGSGTQDVARAAGEQLALWQQRASHPASTRDGRAVAAVVMRTCEQLLVAR